ncbi:putative protein kinase RLK-Pelle-CrRLK1L-1 family transcription factor C2H2 family [Helianthus anomalus]
MPNGTLEDHLHRGDTELSWLQRLTICIGTACGLYYFHTSMLTQHGGIHRDVKTSNILLDSCYFYSGKLTRKSDVYAFGVVLLEVLPGKRAVDPTLDEEQWSLAV